MAYKVNIPIGKIDRDSPISVKCPKCGGYSRFIDKSPCRCRGCYDIIASASEMLKNRYIRFIYYID